MNLVNQSNGTTIDMDLPRGLRLNNPGNIRISTTKWQGEIIPSADKSFKQFVSLAHGYRSMLKLIRNYKIFYGLDTIEKIINRWAPPNENNTSNYIAFVVKDTGIQPTTKINPYGEEPMLRIAAAITKMENGLNTKVDMQAIKDGWKLL